MVAALATAQIGSTAPAVAARLQPEMSNSAPQIGAFTGARIRVPLGGGHEKAQAGLAFTSTLRNAATGELRFSKGAELGFSGDDGTIGVALGGRPASQLAAGTKGPAGRKLGVSTIGWVGIGIGVIAIAAAGYMYWAINRCYECDD